MGITASQFKKALQSCNAYGGQPWSMQELADGANEAARVMGITTRQGLAILVANCMIESAWYRTTVEYGKAGTLRYDPYRGRTFTQNTWLAGYRLVGQYAKKKGLLSDSEYFVKNPTRLGDYKWAWHGPAAYYTANGLVARCNRGGVAELKAVGRIIHAGPGRVNYPTNSHERSREQSIVKAYNALLNAGITAPGGSTSSGPSFTKDAVKRLQGQVGVTQDGAWGPGTDENAQAIRAFLRGGLTPTDAQRKIYMDVRAKRPAGKRTTAEFRKGIQWALGVTADSIWGKNTDAAFEAMRDQHKMSSVKGSLPAPKTASKPATTKKPTVKKPRLAVDGKLGPATYKALQKVVGVKQDGIFGVGSKKATQKWLKVTADGIFGRKSIRALQKKVGASQDGVWGSGTTKALQTYLNKG